MTPFGIYLHWPFCLSKCPYCDFNSHVQANVDEKRWLEAFKKELAYWADLTSEREVATIFLGGGTPSLMSPLLVQEILKEIASLWSLHPQVEITMEANPGTVEIKKFEAFKKAGINRLSIGIQSFRDEDLAFLGRKHSRADVLKALKTVKTLFNRYSFDLIYARPKQTVLSWEEELKEALEWVGDHLSLYQLTIEEGTAFHTLYQRGDLKTPKENLSARLFERTQEILTDFGMPAYEISNHAKPGSECQHNLIYWRYYDYLGIGPGAHGRLTLKGQKIATKNWRPPKTWLDAVGTKEQGFQTWDIVSQEDRFLEMVMMGLRLKEGIALNRFQEELNQSIETLFNLEKLHDLLKEGFLEKDQTYLRATAKGRQRLNGLLKTLLCA